MNEQKMNELEKYFRTLSDSDLNYIKKMIEIEQEERVEDEF